MANFRENWNLSQSWHSQNWWTLSWRTLQWIHVESATGWNWLNNLSLLGLSVHGVQHGGLQAHPYFPPNYSLSLKPLFVDVKLCICPELYLYSRTHQQFENIQFKTQWICYYLSLILKEDTGFIGDLWSGSVICKKENTTPILRMILCLKLQIDN